MKITKKHVFSFIILSIFCLSQIFILLPLTAPAQAEESLFNSQTGINELGAVYGNQKTDIRVIIAGIINVLLGFVAIVFLILILLSGYRYMMAGGNQEKTKIALTQIRNAAIGLAITLGAWAISRWVLLRIRAAVENRVDLFYPV